MRRPGGDAGIPDFQIPRFRSQIADVKSSPYWQNNPRGSHSTTGATQVTLSSVAILSLPPDFRPLQFDQNFKILFKPYIFSNNILCL